MIIMHDFGLFIRYNLTHDFTLQDLFHIVDFVFNR